MSNKQFHEYLCRTGAICDVYKAMNNKDMSEAVMVVRRIYRHVQTKYNIGDSVKSIERSVMFRNAGNAQFGLGKYEQALSLYNTALQFAPKGSTALSLAYGNRSAVLYKLQLYKESKNDIDRCLSLNCPKESIEKLLKRKAEVCRAIAILDTDPLQSKKKHETCDDKSKTNGKMTCITTDINMIVETNVPKIITTNDIELGTVLLQEEPYVTCKAFKKVDNIVDISCYFCKEHSFNLIPCEDCCQALFCNDVCKAKCMAEYHKVECGLLKLALFQDLSISENLAIKSIIKLVSSNTWDELIEASNKMETNASQKTDIFERDGKFAVLNIKDNRPFIYGRMYKEIFFCASIILCLEDIPSFFPDSYKKRHLAIRALARIMMHIVMYCTPIQYLNFNSLGGSLIYGIFPFAKRIKKSSQNNVNATFLHNTIHVAACMSVKCGVEIALPCLAHDPDVPFDTRRLLINVLDNGDVCSCITNQEKDKIKEIKKEQTKLNNY